MLNFLLDYTIRSRSRTKFGGNGSGSWFFLGGGGSGHCFFFSAGSCSKEPKHPAPAPQPCNVQCNSKVHSIRFNLLFLWFRFKFLKLWNKFLQEHHNRSIPKVGASVSDPDPVGSVSFCRVWIRIHLMKR